MKVIILVMSALIAGGLALVRLKVKPESPPEPVSDQNLPSLESLFNRTISEETRRATKPSPLNTPPEAPNEEKKRVAAVSPTPSKQLSLKERCAGPRANDFDCYETYFVETVKNGGIAAAFAELRSHYETPFVKSQCHPLTHVIGNAAAEQFKEVADAYAEGDPFCWSGYYHGVLESFIGRIGITNLEREMGGICVKLRDKRPYSFDHYNCVHGLGHGVMAITQDELFASLKLCSGGLRENSWEEQSCVSGVFMENVIVDGKNHFTKYLKPAEPLYPCTAVDEAYKTTCYLMQTSYMLKVTNGDFKKEKYEFKK